MIHIATRKNEAKPWYFLSLYFEEHTLENILYVDYQDFK